MKISRIDDFLRQQEGMTEITRQTIGAMQLGKLNRLLAVLKERGGYYRDLPDHLDDLSELAELPFTTAEELASNAQGLLVLSQSRVSRVLSEVTSGTTGAGKRVFYSEQDLRNTVALFKAGLGELIGPGGVTMICMPFSGPNGLGELIAEAITQLGARPLKAGCAMTYQEYRELIETERPDTFVGMPVQLLSILRMCGKGSLQRALVSGDYCPDSVTAACEEILGSRLFPHYGSREMALGGAITCPAHEGMHLRENHVIAEIVDEEGRVLPEGEYGELVITTIGMEAMPLVRYRTGDMTRILPGPCPCGSHVLRLDHPHRINIKENNQNRKELSFIDKIDEIIFANSKAIDCRIDAVNSDNSESRSVAAARADLLIVPGCELEQAEEETRIALENAFPKTEFEISAREAKWTDRSLYTGKRI